MMQYSWGHQRRYNSYPEHFRNLFGQRVQKVAVDAGFTCPNRDGTAGRGGCTYCSNDAFNPSYCDTEKGITRQIKEGIAFHRTRYRRAKNYIAYFQAYSNTYAPLDKLRELYQEALSCEGIIGLVIATRPDCVDDEKLDYLASLKKDCYIKIEYGLESVRDGTLREINRKHTFSQSLEALKNTMSRGIPAGAHFIIGLPGESAASMLDDVELISNLEVESLKFHQLQIIKGTPMAAQYLEKPEKFNTCTLSGYLGLMAMIIERLNPLIAIERIAAEVPPRFLVSPVWGMIRYDEILRRFERVLEDKNTWQGRLY
jgi:radical SAM protein (TIGR01212 family)